MGLVYVGRPRTVAAAPLMPSADWGSRGSSAWCRTFCPDQLLLSHHALAGTACGDLTLAGVWRWKYPQRSRLAHGAQAPIIQPMARAAGIQPNPAAKLLGMVHHSTQPIAAGLRCCEAWRSATTGPHL